MNAASITDNKAAGRSPITPSTALRPEITVRHGSCTTDVDHIGPTLYAMHTTGNRHEGFGQ